MFVSRYNLRKKLHLASDDWTVFALILNWKYWVEYTSNCEWFNTKDFLPMSNRFPLTTSTRSPTCRTTHRAPVWSIERSIANDRWFLTFFWGKLQKTTLKLSQKLSKKRIIPFYFLEFCNFVWIMRFLMDYAKSCDLRSIMRNRNIAEYQKPCIKSMSSHFSCSEIRLIFSQYIKSRFLW